MIKIGDAAKHVREKLGLTQRRAAELLEITAIHLCNIEKNKATPSPELLRRYQQLWNVDLYVLSWCNAGDVSRLPESVRDAARKLSEAWKAELDSFIKDDGKGVSLE